MSTTTAEFLLERLHENGVRRIYGYPGDGINAIVGALERVHGQARVRAGAPRGDGRVHGLRAREVDG